MGGGGREVAMTWKESCHKQNSNGGGPGSTTEGSRSSSSSSVRSSSISGRLTAEEFRQQQTTTTTTTALRRPPPPTRSVHFSAVSMATTLDAMVPALPPTRRPPVLPVRNSQHGQGQGRSSDVMMTSIESDVTSSNDFNPSTTVQTLFCNVFSMAEKSLETEISLLKQRGSKVKEVKGRRPPDDLFGALCICVAPFVSRQSFIDLQKK